jgi:hypothetical protein
MTGSLPSWGNESPAYLGTIPFVVLCRKLVLMSTWHPRTIILVGFFLVLLGVVLPFLMILHIIETTFFLSFVSWGSTASGLFLGLIGSARYVRWKKE